VHWSTHMKLVSQVQELRVKLNSTASSEVPQTLMFRDINLPATHEIVIIDALSTTKTLTIHTEAPLPEVPLPPAAAAGIEAATVIYISTSTKHVTPGTTPASPGAMPTPASTTSFGTMTTAATATKDAMDGIHYCPAEGRGGFVYSLCSSGHKSTSGMLESVNGAVVQTRIANGGGAARANNPMARLLG
jgi:hypothetical protein